MTKTNKLKVHSENILPIIKRWLYSEKDIFVRELVSNAVDATRKMKILRDQGEVDCKDDEFRIDVNIDAEAKTLTFSDTGIGMTAEEVENYIAQVAFSSAEQFVEKYQSTDENDQIIGHFGLGFYSSYMAAERVELQTRSFQQEAAPVRWSCDGSTEYELDSGTREQRGTDIILHVSDEEKSYLEENYLKSILQRYCSFVPYPLYLNGEQINTQQPLWKKAPNECTDEEYLSFYRYLYPTDPAPLFWIHLNIDYPFHLQGILYFPKVRRQVEPGKHQIQLYSNRIFVTEGCEEIIPEYLLGLQGVIDSPDIPLNVSRSYLQMDRTVRQLSSHISKKVADRLSAFNKSDHDKYVESWPDVQAVVKLGALQDPKFYERVKDILLWETTDGEWITAEQYLEKNQEKTNGTLFYTSTEKSQDTFLKLYREKEIDVLVADSMLDTFVINFLEPKLEGSRFQRIDGAIDDVLVDTAREKTVLGADGRSEATRIAQLIQAKLNKYDVEVEAKSLASDELPGFVLVDEQQRRMREYMVASDPKQRPEELGFEVARKFVVNTNHKLIGDIETLDKKHPELSEALAEHLYQLSLLSQREMSPEQLNGFVQQSGSLMEQLASQLAKAEDGNA